MNKTVFSKGIFKESLKRLKVSLIIFAAVIIAFQVIPAFFSSSLFDCENIVVTPEQLFTLLPATAIIASVTFIMILFSPFNKRSYSDFAHSIPYTRACIMISKVCAAALALLFLEGLSIGVGYFIYSIVPGYVIDNTDAVGFILQEISVSAFVSTSFLVGVSLTGTTLSNITASLLVMFFPRCIYTTIGLSIIAKAPFLHSINSLPLFSPQYNAFLRNFAVSLFGSDSSSGVSAAKSGIYTLAVSLLYFIIALIIFINRKSETAEQSAPTPRVQTVIRTMIALVPSVIATGVLVCDDEWELPMVLYVIALIAYFTYEIITTKRAKNLLLALPRLGYTVAICIICGVTVTVFANASANYLPKAEDIESVCFYTESDFSYDYLDYNSITKTYMKDKDIRTFTNKVLSSNIKSWKDGKYNNYYCQLYKPYIFEICSNGVNHYRTVYLSDNELDELLKLANKSEDYIKNYMTIPDCLEGTLTFESTSLKGVDEKEIMASLQKDIDSMGFEKWYRINTNGENPYEVMGCDSVPESYCVFYIDYVPQGCGGKHLGLNITNVSFPKTCDLCIKSCYENQSMEKVKKAIEASEKDYSIDDLSYIYARMDVIYNNDFYSEEINVGKDTEVNKEAIKLLKEASKQDTVPDSKNCIIFYFDAVLDDGANYRDTYKVYYLSVPEGYDLKGFTSSAIPEDYIYEE